MRMVPGHGHHWIPWRLDHPGLKDYWTLLSEKRDAVVQVPLARLVHSGEDGLAVVTLSISMGRSSDMLI